MFVSTSRKTVRILGEKGARSLDLQFSNIHFRGTLGRINIRTDYRKSDQTSRNLPIDRRHAEYDYSYGVRLAINAREPCMLGHNLRHRI